MMSDDLPYRPCVGIALFNEDNRVFVGERIDTPGAWQMPQGGIDPGETPEEAFYRELAEEIGTQKAEILHIHEQKLRYDLPPHLMGKGPGSRLLWDGKYRGQEQTWIAARFTGSNEDIDIEAHGEPEFMAWQWIEIGDVLDLIVPFKRDIYRQVIEAFSDITGHTE